MRRLFPFTFALCLLAFVAAISLPSITAQDSSPYARYFAPRTSDPSTAREGQVYANNSSHAPKYYNGSAWKTFAFTDAVESPLTFNSPLSRSVNTISCPTCGLTSNRIDQNNAATTSAQLASVLSDETGSGAAVFGVSPTLTTPNIGAATGTSITLTGNVKFGTASTGNVFASISGTLFGYNADGSTLTDLRTGIYSGFLVQTFTDPGSVSANTISNRNIALYGAASRLGLSGVTIGWVASGDAAGSLDTGLARNTAGVVEVNNGTPGIFRDAKLRHLIAGGSAPTCVVGTAAGTDATCSVVGTDAGGEITVNTGTTAGATDVLVTITFNTAYPSDAYPAISPGNDAAAFSQDSNFRIYVTHSASSFALNHAPDNSAVQDGTTYKWIYNVSGK
jgi:hypothetical protein